MSHDPHEFLPGVHPGQIFKDGCRECEVAAARPDNGIGVLDTERFARAWRRAADWQRGYVAATLSQAEIPLLSALWAVQVQLERRGAAPIGELPGDPPNQRCPNPLAHIDVR